MTGPSAGGSASQNLLAPTGLAPDPAPAPAARRVLGQARFDAGIILRNGEQLLLTLVLPVLVLVGLTQTGIPDLGPGPRIDVVAPGVLALAVISTAFTGQAIALGFDRRYGVLRLLSTTPLGRAGLIAGRALAVLAVQTAQVVVLGAVAVVLGWRPPLLGSVLATGVLVLGTGCFVALAALLAGMLRAEAVLAAANLVWVLLLAGGGVVVPTDLMGVLGTPAGWLPSGALGDATRAALLEGRLDLAAVAVLSGWTVVAVAAAVRFFRWD